MGSLIKKTIKILAIVCGEAALFFIAFVAWNVLDSLDSRAMQGPKTFDGAKTAGWQEVGLAAREKPEVFSLDVPFTAQAPFGDWSQPWQDFCEEAIIVMSSEFSRGATSTLITPSRARDEMLRVMRFEVSTFGYHRDTGADAIAATLTRLYGVPAEVKPVSSPDDIRKEILNYHVIILPLAGRELQNPKFKAPGPLYHTVLIKGFDGHDNSFIANEPGTRFGANHRYDQNLIYQALANWDQNRHTINNNERLMVVVGYK